VDECQEGSGRRKTSKYFAAKKRSLKRIKKWRNFQQEKNSK
jgi:hypothetical protein